MLAVGVRDGVSTSAALCFGVADACEAEGVGFDVEDFGGGPVGSCHVTVMWMYRDFGGLVP